MWLCPACRQTLQRAKGPYGYVWTCSRCGGRGVASVFVRRGIGPEAFGSLWSFANTAPAGRRDCPLCAGRMRLVTADLAEQRAALDVCLSCKFVWCDKEEYVALSQQQHIPAEPGEEPEPDARLDKKWKWIPAILGLPVERVTYDLIQRPWATWGLALSITLVSFLAFLNLPATVQSFGFIPALWWRYTGLTFLTSFLLHAGLLHLVGNLYFLLVFGDNVESHLGALPFLLLVLMATVAGDLMYLVVFPGSGVPGIGASGGISGLVAFYGLQFPKARLLIMLRSLLFYPLRVTAWVALGLWVLFQVGGALFQLQGFTNVNYLAHLGGAAIGVGFWAFLKYR